MPKVTIIIPAYNEAEVIGSVLDSILAIAPPDGWEILVVDDGSTLLWCEWSAAYALLLHVYFDVRRDRLIHTSKRVKA